MIIDRLIDLQYTDCTDRCRCCNLFVVAAAVVGMSMMIGYYC